MSEPPLTREQGRRSMGGTGESGAELVPIPCCTCRHYITAGACSAYPRGIPADTLSWRTPHTGPLPGDRGIRYEPAPAGWTDGPVAFVPIRMTTDRANGWDTVGALWLGDDGACGFEPEPAYAARPEAMGWVERLREAWRRGARPAAVFAHWSRYNNGMTIAAGRVGRAASLRELRGRLGPPREPGRRPRPISLPARRKGRRGAPRD